MALINCDMGESFGIWKLGDDAAMMPLIDIANVACGFHASDYNHMRATVRLAKRHGVKVGAHPSLPDLQGFGRREMKIGGEELANCLIYQIGALKGFLEVEGVPLHHIKPHGSLYGMAAKDPAIAHVLCDVADIFRVPLLGMIGTEHDRVYVARGHTLMAEYYVDRDYDEAGQLIIVRERGALAVDVAIERTLRAVRQRVVQSTAGTDVAVRADTICIHSDTPGAPVICAAVGQALVAAGLKAPRAAAVH